MKKVTIICDACGREIQPSYFRNARLDFKIDEWGGGSAGGREDIFIQEADLCSECAHKLQKFIENELNIQPHHPNQEVMDEMLINTYMLWEKIDDWQ